MLVKVFDDIENNIINYLGNNLIKFLIVKSIKNMINKKPIADLVKILKFNFLN